MKVQLPDEIASKLYFQDYTPLPEIDGVFYQVLKKHRALEGWFMEQFRLEKGFVEGLPFPFEIRQLSFAHAIPHRINAFHLHPKEIQDELWCVVQGSMKVCLVDVREGSSTYSRRRSYILCGDLPGLLYIPSGVAHGYQAGSDGALLLYAMNNSFNLQDPNEGRLPWDFFGPELWSLDRG